MEVILLAEEVKSRYERFLEAIAKYNPEAPVKHQKVVESLRACASNLKLTEPDPIKRMVTQIECARGMAGLKTVEELEKYTKEVLKVKKAK